MKAADKKAKERYLRKLELVRKSGKVNPFETEEERKAAIQRAKDDPEFCVQRFFPHYATSECAPFQIEYAWLVANDPNFTGFAKWGRGLAKSVWNNVIIPFWLWLREGEMYFVLVGVSESRAVRLLEDLRAEFEGNPQIIADFGEQKKFGSWEDSLWITSSGFIAQAVGFGQSCRGIRVGTQRPKHYNLDDLETKETIKNEKRQKEMVEWVEGELLPSMDGDFERLCFSNNWFAPVMFLRMLADLHPDWIVHEVKAYNPITYEPAWTSKYTPQYYRKKEKRMGVLVALAEYNHEAKMTGKDFKSEWIVWDKMPNLNHFKIIVGHWDVAYAGTETSDYNAIRIWGLCKDNLFWYIQGYVKKSKMAPAVEYMCDVQSTLPSTVIIHWQFESQFWNDEVQRVLKEVQKEKKVRLNISKIDTPRGKKYDRIKRMVPRYQNNRIRYNIRMKSDNDTQVGLHLLYGIEPNYTTKDDAPDADDQAQEVLEKHIPINDEEESDQIICGSMEPNNERI
ncbi:hypothetical protein [Sphingobacterium sp. ML3W]|uniref:hypothetical protein n=1 Tax=Sphingobacterium sp. ML3W TaxID=1538644 RepID=UPI00068FE1DD|nr:hypothetical protein [Sphingobacterium sp. ML3W]